MTGTPRRVLAALSASALTIAGTAVAIPATASAAPQFVQDQNGTYVTFGDLDDQSEDVMEDVIVGINGLVGSYPLTFTNLRGPRSAVVYNPLTPKRTLVECTVEESMSPDILCWSVLDD